LIKLVKVREISKICVMGSGTMGAGIAAHFANLGFHVVLLDKEKSIAELGLERAKKASPPHFYTDESLKYIQIDSIQNFLPRLEEVDWVCEAIVENESAKRDLYEQIEPYLAENTWVTTNTSGFQIHDLIKGRTASFQKRFLGTHFFNPPRYLKLVELISTEKTDPESVKEIHFFLEHQAAKRVVHAKDTPGFIANRFGMWSMFHAIHVAEKLGISVEEVDLLTGPFLGRPKSASFRLNDLIGLDIMQNIANNIYNKCPEDPYHEIFKTPKSLRFLLEHGWIGAKVDRGYYFKHNHEMKVFDLSSLTYRELNLKKNSFIDELMQFSLVERINKGIKDKGKEGLFLREYFLLILKYAMYVFPEVCFNVQDFDQVMKWGFGWEMGPFEMIDALDLDKLKTSPHFYQDEKVQDCQGQYVPVKKEPEYRESKDFKLIESMEGFNLRDLEDGVIGIGLNLKMGFLRPRMIQSLYQYLLLEERPIVLYSEAPIFSAGFDLRFFLKSAISKNWNLVDEALEDLQKLTELMSQKKIISAVHGFCLGGGLEIALACPAMIVQVESKLGFPESKVGLLPAGTGTSRMYLFNQDNEEQLLQLLKLLTIGASSLNAKDACLIGYVRLSDQVVFHPDRLFEEAKEKVQQLKSKTLPEWKKAEPHLASQMDTVLEDLYTEGKITEYDQQIGKKILEIFCHSDSWKDALKKERKYFVELLGQAQTQSRIEHMLQTGQPLKNER